MNPPTGVLLPTGVTLLSFPHPQGFLQLQFPDGWSASHKHSPTHEQPGFEDDGGGGAAACSTQWHTVLQPQFLDTPAAPHWHPGPQPQETPGTGSVDDGLGDTIGLDGFGDTFGLDGTAGFVCGL